MNLSSKIEVNLESKATMLLAVIFSYLNFFSFHLQVGPMLAAAISCGFLISILRRNYWQILVFVGAIPVAYFLVYCTLALYWAFIFLVPLILHNPGLFGQKY